MSDFSATIRAMLDTADIEKQISSLQSRLNKIDTLKLKINLDSGSLDVKALNNLLTRNLSNAGTNAGQSFTKSLNSSLNKIHLVNGGIGNVKNMLQGAGFDTKSINSITQDLNKMILTINKINTSQLSNGNIKMAISGVDELGRAVNIVRTFDKETGNVINTTKSFLQVYKDIPKSMQSTFSKIQLGIDTGDFKDKIDSIKTEFRTLGNANKETIQNFNALKAAFNTLNSSDAGIEEKITAYEKFNSLLPIVKRQISSLSKQESNTSQVQEFNELYEILQKINSTKVDIKALELKSGNTNSIELLKTQLEGLRERYKKLLSDSNVKLSHEQYDTLRESCRQAEEAIKALIEKSNDAKQKFAEKIQLGIDTGDFETKFQGIKNSFQSLGNVSEIVKTNFNSLNTAFNTLKDDNASIEDKIAAYQKFNNLLPIITRQVKELKSEENKESKKNLTDEITSVKSSTLLNKVKGWMNENTAAAKEYEDELIEIQALLANDKDPVSLKKASAKFQEVVARAKEAGLVTNKFVASLKDTAKQLLGLTSPVAVIQTAIKYAQKMYQEVYNIDTAMTNLKKVTDETDYSYSSFLSRASKSAKELGRTISGVVTQTSEWAKLGYSLSEAEELSKWSSIYANVGEVDDETAVSDIVTAMKAFKIEASSANTIVDSLNELGNSFAVSSSALGQGLSNSASALSAAGTDMYKTLAMIAGGSEITQDANEFGNFLKVASMRIQGMKGEVEALGEEVDESVDSISKVQTQILNLTHGKVNIFDNTGEFRNYYDIIKDISEVVDDLTSTEQASLYEILFGKMRGNQGIALIQAFQSGQVEKAYEAALGSDGSAMAEQEKWLDSLEAKTQQLKASWEELSNTVIDSDFMKGLIDTGTTALSVLSNIIDEIGVLNVALTGFAGYKAIKSIS